MDVVAFDNLSFCREWGSIAQEKVKSVYGNRNKQLKL